MCREINEKYVTATASDHVTSGQRTCSKYNRRLKNRCPPLNRAVVNFEQNGIIIQQLNL